MTTEYSIQKMVSDGTLSTIALGIQYLQRNDIYIRIAGEETPQSGASNGYTWSFLDNTTLKILPVVPNGVEVVVYRRTDVDAMYNIYSQNAQFDEATIDENNQQLLYIAQEYLEQGIPGAGIDNIEFLRDDGTNTYYRIIRTDGSYSDEFYVPSAGSITKVLARESLRRSYAEAGYNLVDGSFEAGGTLVSANDVLLQERTGKAFSGPVGTVTAGTNPASSGFVDRSGELRTWAGTAASLASGVHPVGGYVTVTDRGFGLFLVQSGGTADGFSTLSAGAGKTAVYQPQRSEVWLEHLGGLPGTDVTNALNAAKLYSKNNNLKLCVGAGEFRITDEIDFSYSCNIECATPNDYRSEGTVWIVDVNDPLKHGFYFGKTDKVISPYVNNLKFKPVSPCASSMFIECATFNGGKFIFDSNNLQYNGLLIKDWYIGEIQGVEGTGKSYLFKITGNASGVVRNINAGAVSEDSGAYSVQIASLNDGFFRIENMYLEAQSRKNLIIVDCNKTSSVLIDKVYEETQAHPVEISNSNCVQIIQYRTNLSDNGIVVAGSKGINIGVLPVGAFEKNPVVTVLDDSDVSVTVLQNNYSGSLVDGRDYSLVVGELSGTSATGVAVNGELLPSAGKSKLPFSDGTIVQVVPANKNQLVSDTSIQLGAGNIVSLPIASLRAGKRYAIKLIYKSNGGENACLLRIRGATILKTFASFNVASADFRTLNFVFEAPSAPSNRYVGLNFENVSGTAIVHQLAMCEIGGDSIPSRIMGDRIHIRQEIDLSITGVVALTDSVAGLKVSRYELQYSSTASAGAVVDVGVMANTGVFGKYVSFAVGGGSAGLLEGNMTTTVDLKDQAVIGGGLFAQVTGGGSGRATLHIYLERCDYQMVLD